jgi:hypothetical protein
MSICLKPLQLLAGLLYLGPGILLAQEANEIVRCRTVADDEQRLACYDAIPAARPSPLRKYELVPLDELKEFALSYRGRLVETTGYLRPGGGYLLLGLDSADATPMPVDSDSLPRRERETLLERCGSGCEATVQGRVRPVNFTTGILVVR